jgi:hypothetical protein
MEYLALVFLMNSIINDSLKVLQEIIIFSSKPKGLIAERHIVFHIFLTVLQVLAQSLR